MKHFISILAALGASVLVAQQASAPADGKVVGVIQWFTVVADLPKAEQFYHETMGLESVGGDPRMRLEYYAVVPFLIDMYDNKSDFRNFGLRIPGSDMGVEPGQWKEVAGKLLPSRIQDPGAGHLILKTWNINGFMSRIAKGGVQVLTLGGHPESVDRSRPTNGISGTRAVSACMLHAYGNSLTDNTPFQFRHGRDDCEHCLALSFAKTRSAQYFWFWRQ